MAGEAQILELLMKILQTAEAGREGVRSGSQFGRQAGTISGAGINRNYSAPEKPEMLSPTRTGTRAVGNAALAFIPGAGPFLSAGASAATSAAEAHAKQRYMEDVQTAKARAAGITDNVNILPEFQAQGTNATIGAGMDPLTVARRSEATDKPQGKALNYIADPVGEILGFHKKLFGKSGGEDENAKLHNQNVIAQKDLQARNAAASAEQPAPVEDGGNILDRILEILRQHPAAQAGDY